MDLADIYNCFCDPTRLRILNLLTEGPLCVCHLQDTLAVSQVKISKHLSYLKKHRLVQVRREANWRIYSLSDAPSPAVRRNLACLKECAKEEPRLRADLQKLAQLREAKQCSPRSKFVFKSNVRLSS